ncbi:Sister chromatid cohesion protein PDS5 B-A [Zea mays]|uniref:Sister chromatid cohesion protein PDS5 B-A n=1 Tax=Zea mays TaxID=4577 RepID=A0A3L6E3N0_MAIZE|nr:Sister chromatid cohesion protein PDS5 B-A [Zea mays]
MEKASCEVEECLLKVEQSPPESTSNALQLATTTLVKKEPLAHADSKIRLAVASCISEITRVTAPDAPYDDDAMKDVFSLIMEAFKHLDDIESPFFGRRTSILDTVSKVRSCVAGSLGISSSDGGGRGVVLHRPLLGDIDLGVPAAVHCRSRFTLMLFVVCAPSSACPGSTSWPPVPSCWAQTVQRTGKTALFFRPMKACAPSSACTASNAKGQLRIMPQLSSELLHR